MNCDICGKDLQQEGEDNTSIYIPDSIGMLLRIDESHHEYDDFIKMFGKPELSSCFCCFAKHNGFKEV